MRKLGTTKSWVDERLSLFRNIYYDVRSLYFNSSLTIDRISMMKRRLALRCLTPFTSTLTSHYDIRKQNVVRFNNLRPTTIFRPIANESLQEQIRTKILKMKQCHEALHQLLEMVFTGKVFQDKEQSDSLFSMMKECESLNILVPEILQKNSKFEVGCKDGELPGSLNHVVTIIKKQGDNETLIISIFTKRNKPSSENENTKAIKEDMKNINKLVFELYMPFLEKVKKKPG